MDGCKAMHERGIRHLPNKAWAKAPIQSTKPTVLGFKKKRAAMKALTIACAILGSVVKLSNNDICDSVVRRSAKKIFDYRRVRIKEIMG